ncbi:MAG: methylated-DNA--[protein]-cysteine S-methyltransferase [Armatimonadetes bacterium]|nr:methylated-DNA--[protein]-cysteine S-methyltransferase [Armatimonadota bacterium]
MDTAPASWLIPANPHDLTDPARDREGSPVRFAIFQTALGPCAVVWSARGIRAVCLAEPDPERLRAGLSVTARESEPPDVARRIVLHLEGSPQPFDDVALDLDGVPEFRRQVYEAARLLASGETCTYGALAERIGQPGAARAVGQALGRNPVPVIVPCHRILAAGGKPGGFSAPGGLDTKRLLLEAEGVRLDGARSLWDAGTLDAAVAHLEKRDRAMRRIISDVGPCHLHASREEDLFASLCDAVVHQQVAGAAARAISARFRALFEGPPSPRAIHALSEEALRGAGLSGAKVRTLRAVSEAVLAGKVEIDRLPRLSDEQVRKQLTGVKGIGDWTSDMLLIFHMGRPDVWPVGDYGIRKAVQLAHGLLELPSIKEMPALGERYRPYRTVASWYLWRSLSVKEPIPT